MHPQPLIAVTDVEASSRWYQYLLGCQSAHGGREYERLVRDGTLMLQLHHQGVEHHHGQIGNPNAGTYGNGVLLWFEIDDFDAAVSRITDLGAEIVLAPYSHTGAAQREVWLKDPDGFVVVLSCPDGEAA